MASSGPDDQLRQRAERWQLLRTIDRMLERPLIVLSFVWLAILAFELAGRTNRALDALFYFIWVVFIAEVIIQLVIAPSRRDYLRTNWLKVVALFVPALRALRVVTALRFLRGARVVRSAGLLRVLTSINRGMSALAETLGRARFSYAIALTGLVIVIGAAGMLFFEREVAPEVRAAGGRGLESYGDALWWSAMAMTTVGSDYFPLTAEGRVLGWLLSVFALGVFGYITATIASHLLGLGDRRPDRDRAAVANEVAALRREIATLTRHLEDQAGGAPRSRRRKTTNA